MKIKIKDLKTLVENFLKEESDTKDSEQNEKEKTVRIEEELPFNEGTIILTLTDTGDSVKTVIKDKSGNDISNQFSPKHLSAMLSRLFTKSFKDDNKELKGNIVHLMKKVHNDIDDEANEEDISKWIKNRQTRYIISWSKEIDGILKRKKVNN